ncbi:MAG TPA: SET domain-containing protein-lysine N-methyltransferase [Polyangia bacterium]
MPLVDGVRVVKSSIHGYGVVATRRYKEGELVVNVDGVPLRRSELQNDDYCLLISDDLFFDMVDQTRWINHSCDPNTEVEADVDESGRVWAHLVALRDIEPGEELTFDYAFASQYAIPCRCGSRQCRGLIIDPDEVPVAAAAVAGARV